MDYEIKAIKGQALTVLTVSANALEDAMQQVRARGYIPLSSKVVKASNKRNAKFPLALFSQELLYLLEAGLNLVEAIETLLAKSDNDTSAVVIRPVLDMLYQGRTFSGALSEFPDIFPLLYVATIRSSEKTGHLAEALSRYIAYEAQINSLKKKIISASIYPLLLMGVGGLVIAFLLGFVVPKFSHIYEGTGGELPWLSQLLLSWGQFLDANKISVAYSLLFGAVILVFLLKQPSVKAWCLQQVWRIPSVGEHMKLFQLARFYRTLGMLLNGGTPIIEALRTVDGLLERGFQSKLRVAETLVKEGQPLSQAMLHTDLTTPVALRLLTVGERGGNIGSMMEKIAGFYEESLSRWIDWFTRLFEPLLMLFIGLVIGVVVLLLYMPIFELAGSIQ